MQADFFRFFKADVKYVVGKGEAHWLAPSIPKMAEDFLYDKW